MKMSSHGDCFSPHVILTMQKVCNDTSLHHNNSCVQVNSISKQSVMLLLDWTLLPSSIIPSQMNGRAKGKPVKPVAKGTVMQQVSVQQ